jgi:predicted component of type VI protein secretion system
VPHNGRKTRRLGFGYLVVALYELHGFDGLETGLTLFGDIVNADYWTDLYPKRKKGKTKPEPPVSSGQPNGLNAYCKPLR